MTATKTRKRSTYFKTPKPPPAPKGPPPKCHMEWAGVRYEVSPPHPLKAHTLPVSDDAFLAMLDTFDRGGQRLDIIRDQHGRIVDGRYRELACRVKGVRPTYVTKTLTDEQAYDEIGALDFARRNMNSSQRGMWGSDIRDAYVALTGKKISLREAAAKAHAPEVYVNMANRIKKSDPEVAELVRAGELNSLRAVQVIRNLDAEERQKVKDSEHKDKTARELLDHKGVSRKRHTPGPVVNIDKLIEVIPKLVAFLDGHPKFARQLGPLADEIKAAMPVPAP